MQNLPLEESKKPDSAMELAVFQTNFRKIRNSGKAA
jgi:hypothetical protein